MSELEIFGKAWEIKDSRDREAYLAEACSGNRDLQIRIERLLSASRDTETFMESSTLFDSDDGLTDIGTGAEIGPYTLEKKIGEGGMGVVFVARQDEPIHRRVALKIIKPWMDCEKIVSRFESEQRTLAMMDHPNIARVLDAGTTDSGLPYFVMELVAGKRIDVHCDEGRLSIGDRIELFIEVCQAVQHAHQKGIIHRDLKPSNILIANYEGTPTPKVIDFGVAKAVSASFVDHSNSTQFGFLVGTLEYMSPEQAGIDRQDVDTRSDIYSLGAVLYELLIGRTPFDKERIRSAGLDELLAMISGEEPPMPSTALEANSDSQAIASCRKTTSAKLELQLKGDLDWIVSKALAKERVQRYESTDALVLDLQRHLRDDPVSAGPPSAAYKFQKFYRRNKSLLVASIVCGLLLAAGTVVSTSLAIRANRAEKLARGYLKDANQNLILARQATKEANDARLEAEETLADLAESRQVVDQQQQFIFQSSKSPLAGEETDWSQVAGFGRTDERGRDLAIQPDGKIVVVGVVGKTRMQHSQDFLVARYNADGSIDTSFNQTGFNVVDFGQRWRDIATNVAIQHDGKIVAAGVGVDYAHSRRPFHLTVARFGTDGRREKTFSCNPFLDCSASDVLPLADGKILLLSPARDREGWKAIMLTRLNSDLTIDTNFGDNGHAVHEYPKGPCQGWEMARQSDGKIVVAGVAASQAYVVRFQADGSIDNTYADDGHSRFELSVTGGSSFRGIVLDAEHNAYLSGSSVVSVLDKEREMIVAKLDRNGRLDNSFSDDGMFRSDHSWDQGRGQKIAMDKNGKLVVVGKSGDSSFALRLHPDGSLDESFGYQGCLQFGRGQLNSVEIDSLNRPVFAGSITENFWLVRLKAN